MASLTYECAHEERMTRRVRQGLGALVTNARLWASLSSRGRQICCRLHKDEELILGSETLLLPACLHRRTPAPVFEEKKQNREQRSSGSENIS